MVLDPIGQHGESRLRVWLAPFEGGRARLIVLLAITWLLLTLQSVAATHPRLRLDLGVLVVIYVALEYAMVRGAVTALLIGYLGDVFSGESRGLMAASMVLVFVLVRLMVVRVTGSRWLMITSISALGVIVRLAFHFGIEAFAGPNRSTFRAIVPALPALIFGTALLGFPVYRLLRLVDDRFKPRDEPIRYGSSISNRWS